MSRTLGIFQGKKERYNKLILKSLLPGPKTTMQIAEYIYNNDTYELNELKNRRNDVLRIYSVISRKESRLSELSDKKYILREDSKWNLTIKGTCLSLTLYEENEIKRVVDFKKVPNLNFVNIVELVEKIPLMDALLSTKKGKKYVKETLSAFERKQSSQLYELFVFKIRDATRDIASKGVDIDSMDMIEFTLLLGTNISSWMTDTIFQDSLKAK